MTLEKIVRNICYFSDKVDAELFERIDQIQQTLEQHDFELQTRRICLNGMTIKQADDAIQDNEFFVAVGSLDIHQAREQFDAFVTGGNKHFSLDITEGVTLNDVNVLFDIIQSNARKTFNFTYSANIPPSSPFFPSANYERTGFSIGLQSTNLSAGCDTVDAWLDNMRIVWDELMTLFAEESDFLGIDSSVAPLFDGDGSLIQFIERVHAPFPHATTTDVFTRISHFIKTQNPQPVGLCGLMFPCLEDAVLAHQYAEGEFSIERNLFLSLHCGLGIDTYPIAIDEKPERVLEVLQLLSALSNRYQKPLAARFVSDGNARIGDMTDLQNQYLQDVVVRKL